PRVVVVEVVELRHVPRLPDRRGGERRRGDELAFADARAVLVDERHHLRGEARVVRGPRAGRAVAGLDRRGGAARRERGERDEQPEREGRDTERGPRGGNGQTNVAFCVGETHAYCASRRRLAALLEERGREGESRRVRDGAARPDDRETDREEREESTRHERESRRRRRGVRREARGDAPGRGLHRERNRSVEAAR